MALRTNSARTTVFAVLGVVVAAVFFYIASIVYADGLLSTRITFYAAGITSLGLSIAYGGDRFGWPTWLSKTLRFIGNIAALATLVAFGAMVYETPF
jgi:hypothetical protein